MVQALTQDVIGHGPQLETNTTQGLKVSGVQVLVVLRVGDLSRVPFALVRRVLLLGSNPLAL